jgi:steroid delta-isomerase-like uncharacterized protein
MPNDIRQLSRDWYERVWNQRDKSAITELASSNVMCQGLSEDGLPVYGLELFYRFHTAFLSAFPDLKLVVEDVLVEGDKSCTRLTFSGTHLGEGVGVPATGQRFVSTAIVIMRWQNGQIIEGWNEFDAAGMMRQLQAPTATLRA